MHGTEWQTRTHHIAARLRGLNPPWAILPYHAGLDLTRLNRHAVTEFPTANGPGDWHGYRVPFLYACNDPRIWLLDTPPDILPLLRDYQRRCLLATEAAVLAGRKLLVAMATALGKTLLPDNCLFELTFWR